MGYMQEISYKRGQFEDRSFAMLAGAAVILASSELHLIRSAELVTTHDVHAFYHLHQNVHPRAISIGGMVLHVQAYPGLSDEEGMQFSARYMDLEARDAARRDGATVGNEHQAVVGMAATPDRVIWDPVQLATLLHQEF